MVCCHRTVSLALNTNNVAYETLSELRWMLMLSGRVDRCAVEFSVSLIKDENILAICVVF